ncbi:MAG: phosphoesterase RecJ protein [Oscillospiraceae bacterium]|nr:phosphoesterase RecJ protein [Oscillospiraceae bacterium]
MEIDLLKTIEMLKQSNHILILMHHHPDGDTLGSGYGLFYALKGMGKTVRAICSDPIPQKYSYFTDQAEFDEMDPQLIVAVDVADAQLLGSELESYKDKVDLCIDHHRSNNFYAKNTYLAVESSATCEAMFDVVTGMGAKITPLIADCLYTGVATDTGCFKFSNTTSKTHDVAAKLIDLGADYVMINRIMFETKTKNRIVLEQSVLSTMEFFFDNRCAIICISSDVLHKSGAEEDDLDGVSSLPKQIEGVDVGVTLREKADGTYRVSMRTSEQVDASKICQAFGGGGHLRAAGCTVQGSYLQAKQEILDQVKIALGV